MKFFRLWIFAGLLLLILACEENSTMPETVAPSLGTLKLSGWTVDSVDENSRRIHVSPSKERLDSIVIDSAEAIGGASLYLAADGDLYSPELGEMLSSKTVISTVDTTNFSIVVLDEKNRIVAVWLVCWEDDDETSSSSAEDYEELSSSSSSVIEIASSSSTPRNDSEAWQSSSSSTPRGDSAASSSSVIEIASSSSSSRGDSEAWQSSSSSSSRGEVQTEILGTCAPDKDSIVMTEYATWTFTQTSPQDTSVASDLKFKWVLEGSYQETASGTGKRTTTAQYPKVGVFTAKLSIDGGDTITCSPLTVTVAPITGCECTASTETVDVSDGYALVTWNVSGCKSLLGISSYTWSSNVSATWQQASLTFTTPGESVTPTVAVSNDNGSYLEVTCPTVTSVGSK